MNAIRVVGFAAILSALLMAAFAKTFFVWWVSSATYHSWTMAMNAISPTMANAAGINAVGAAVFICLCIGAALLMTSSIYPALGRLARRASGLHGKEGHIEVSASARNVN